MALAHSAVKICGEAEISTAVKDDTRVGPLPFSRREKEETCGSFTRQLVVAD